MAIPTITTAGSAGGLLLITDHEGTVRRIPKNSVSSITDSSNSDIYRLDVRHVNGECTLKFASAEEVTNAISLLDAQY